MICWCSALVGEPRRARPGRSGRRRRAARRCAAPRATGCTPARSSGTCSRTRSTRRASAGSTPAATVRVDRPVVVEQVDHAQLGELGHGGARRGLRSVCCGSSEVSSWPSRRSGISGAGGARACRSSARWIDDASSAARARAPTQATAPKFARDVFVGERQRGRRRRPASETMHEAAARLERGGVADREEVDQRERAARAAGRRRTGRRSARRPTGRRRRRAASPPRSRWAASTSVAATR